MFRLRFRHDFPELLTLEDFDRVLASTEDAPALIYKHSLTCGTSAVALEQMTRFAAAHPGTPVHLVPVQKARPVSDAIEDRFDLRHESPQLILVDQGTVRWHASHFRVTADAARTAIAGLNRPGAGTESPTAGS